AVLCGCFPAEKHFPILKVRVFSSRGKLLLQKGHRLIQDCSGPKLVKRVLRRSLGGRFTCEAFLAQPRVFQRNNGLSTSPLERLTAAPFIRQEMVECNEQKCPKTPLIGGN